jgi:excisionase family DNA binding protein
MTTPALVSPPERPSPAESAVVFGLRVLTATEVASVLRVDTDAIVRAIRNGELPGNRIGQHWRVEESALANWLQGAYGRLTQVTSASDEAPVPDER